MEFWFASVLSVAFYCGQKTTRTKTLSHRSFVIAIGKGAMKSNNLNDLSDISLLLTDAINAFDGGERQALDHPNATCGIFTTFPAPYLTLTAGFFEQIVNTGLMLGLIHVIGDGRNAGSPFNLAPLFYGLIVTAIILTYGVNAGSPLNPARDFAGRLMCAIAGYGPRVWAPYGVQWWWVATFGPLLGAAVGSLIYLLFVEIHHPPEDRSPKDGLIELREEYKDTKKEFNQNEDVKTV